MDDVILDGEVFVEKIGAVGVICYDTAHFGGGKKNIIGFFGGKEMADGGLITKV